MINISKLQLAYECVAVDATEAKPVANDSNTAGIIDNAFIHANVGVKNLSCADLAICSVYIFYSDRSVHLMRCEEIMTSKNSR